MLGRNWRLSVNNQFSSSVTVTIKARLWNFASNGAITYSTEQVLMSAVAVSTSTTVWTQTSNIDNSSLLYLGAELVVTLVPSASGTGTITVQLQRSTDGATTWPDQGRGEFVGAYNYPTASSSTVLTNMAIGA